MFTRLSRVSPLSCVAETSTKLVWRALSSASVSPIFKPVAIKALKVENEPLLSYEVGSPERSKLKQKLNHYLSQCEEIPIVIGDKHYRTANTSTQVLPFDHGHKLAVYHLATPSLYHHAILVSLERAREWESIDVNDRIQALLKAADLVSGKYRQDLNAATMLGQGKTAIQAEIDSAAELTDFLRLNAYYLQDIYSYQPWSPKPNETRNAFRLRSLEGFVAAISPFNFTAIAGNLATAPALMGNAVVWKPSNTSILSNWIIFKILQEAGFAPGAISFIPSDPIDFSNHVISSPDLAAVNFTGSVKTFRTIWKNVASNIETNKTFPRLIGECGGKDFHFIHPTAELKTTVAQTIRAAFEYSGQKCSACSRLYVPKSLWPKIKEEMVEIVKQIKLGSPLEFDTFLSAVIDQASFDRNKSYQDYARANPNHTIVVGGVADSSKGYYIHPTIVETSDPRSKLMVEEIFGPILTVYVYEDSQIDETLDLVDRSTPFGLTGAIFAQDREWLAKATDRLEYSAGNLYINDKCTGAVVGQQPFGGARLSGTNDKGGAPHYLLRFCSPQNIKETFIPLPDWRYPYMDAK